MNKWVLLCEKIFCDICLQQRLEQPIHMCKAGQTGPLLEFIFWTAETGFIHVREMSEKFNFFQGQGIVREFCDASGKNEILQKCQGNVRELFILT